MYLYLYSVAKETPAIIAEHLHHPDFPLLLQQFLYTQLASNPNAPSIDDVPQSCLPPIHPHALPLSIYHSAIATFFAPCDLSGIGGMCHEHICAIPSWQKGLLHFDTILVSTDQQLQGMRGLDVAHVRLFFSFTYENTEYPCALIDWYGFSDTPDEDMDMWIVKPVWGHSTIIHLAMILWCAHLIPVFGLHYIYRSLKLTFNDSLDAFSNYCYGSTW